MVVTVARIYEKPSGLGFRMLVDRLWPRGVKKIDARIDVWRKELAPSTKLRTWFHEDTKGRYAEFTKRYRTELKTKKMLAKSLLGDARRVVLVTAVKDIPHSHIPTLITFMKTL